MFLFGGALPANATTIQEVTSRSGVKAWLVEDHKLPLVALQFAFRGGVEQDPVDKQGLANLTMDLVTEGAGQYDASAFQQQLADNSVALHVSAERDALTGSLKSLSADKDKAFGLLHLALTQPRFEPKDIERLKAEQLAGLRVQFGNPGWQARYALFRQIFGDHPYGERRLGSVKSLSRLQRGDIIAFAKDHFARDNLVVAVAGDITPKDLATALDKIFGDLPRHAKLKPVGEINLPAQPVVILVPREGTQTELLFAMAGPKRDDPDWHAAEIANYILGGGGFSSRLMQDVRDKKGLTYGIDTGLAPMVHGGLIVGDAATDNPKTAEAWDIATATMKRFYEDGPTEKEINAAKDFLTGELPLAMTSTDKIAGLLVGLQLDNLDIHYLDQRNERIRATSADDIDRVIKRWFNPAGLTLSMVGKPDGITPTLTQPLVRE